MGNNFDGMVYHFGTIDEMRAAIEAFVKAMNDHLDDVSKKFTELVTLHWQGISAGEFDGARRQWEGNADAMATTLRDLANKVAAAGTNFAATDASAY